MSEGTRDSLLRLADAMVEDVLATSDADILAEQLEDVTAQRDALSMARDAFQWEMREIELLAHIDLLTERVERISANEKACACDLDHAGDVCEFHRARFEDYARPLSTENRRLREALEPFADRATKLEEWHKESEGILLDQFVVRVNYSDCVRARAALSPAQKGEV